MTDPIDPAFPGDQEVERRLEAFADVRLSPSGHATTRMRMQAMAVAHRRAALLDAERSSSAGAPGHASGSVPRPAVFGAGPAVAVAWRRGWLRPLGAMAAALMTLTLLAGTAAAARPGGPLYDALLFTERLTLPGETTARATAESHRLDARLREALDASSVGDEPAILAAILAYSTIVTEGATALEGDLGAQQRFESHVTGQTQMLTSMLQRVSDPARLSLEAAIAASRRHLHLDEGGSSSSAAKAVGGAPSAPGDPWKTAKPPKTDQPPQTQQPPTAGKPPTNDARGNGQGDGHHDDGSKDAKDAKPPKDEKDAKDAKLPKDEKHGH